MKPFGYARMVTLPHGIQKEMDTSNNWDRLDRRRYVLVQATGGLVMQRDRLLLEPANALLRSDYWQCAGTAGLRTQVKSCYTVTDCCVQRRNLCSSGSWNSVLHLQQRSEDSGIDSSMPELTLRTQSAGHLLSRTTCTRARMLGHFSVALRQSRTFKGYGNYSQGDPSCRNSTCALNGGGLVAVVDLIAQYG